MTVETVDGSGDPIVKSGPYNGNGVTASFDYDFQIQDAEELLVTRQNADQTETVLVLTTDYTVSGVGADAGGSITLVDPATDLVTGTKLIIQYVGGYVQPVDYSNQGSIKLELLEVALDRVTMHLRSLKELVDRAVKVDAFETADINTLTANINTLAAIASDLTTLAGINADILTVAGIDMDVSAVAAMAGEVTNFADVYQGAAASDPATRSDATALQEGDLYFNTADNELRVWDGAAWQDVRTSPHTHLMVDVTDITALGRTLLANSTAVGMRGTIGANDAGNLTTGTLDIARLPEASASSFYATYGGTANAITLTTPLSLAALSTGQEFRFRATATNTGATTINVDGIGAKTAKTVTGAALPADYIRTDIDTVCRYDGTDFIVLRETEYGSNANGEYARFANGLQIALTYDIETRVSSGDHLTSITLPATFADAAIGPGGYSYNTTVTVHSSLPSVVNQSATTSPGASGLDVYIYRTTATNTAFSVSVTGIWY